MIEHNKIYHTDCLAGLQKLPDGCIDCCVTSPPYFGLRDYGHEGQIGLEETPEKYVQKMVEVFNEVKRVLKKEGTLWLNLGDSYAANGIKNTGRNDEGKKTFGSGTFRGGNKKEIKVLTGLKPKDLIGIPWAVAFALRSSGWYLRQDIIWHKPNPMPESVTDRCTKSHEYIFLLSKSQKYYYDYESVQEVATGYDGRNDTKMNGSQKYLDGDYLAAGNANSLSKGSRERWKYKNLSEKGQQPNSMHLKRLVGEEFLSPVRNKRSVWTVTTKPFSEAHFATFPEDLIVDCIKAGCPERQFTCSCCGFIVNLHESNTIANEAISKEMQELWQAISGSRYMEQGENFLREEMQFGVDSQEQGDDKGVDNFKQGVQNDSSTRSPEQNHVRVYDGASANHGKTFGQAATQVGGCASQESQQIRQQDREPGVTPKGRSRQVAETTNKANYLSSLWQENKSFGPCPKCSKGEIIGRRGVILDCFMGAGTTALVAAKLNRNYIGFELNADYIKIAEKRLRDELGMFNKAV